MVPLAEDAAEFTARFGVDAVGGSVISPRRRASRRRRSR